MTIVWLLAFAVFLFIEAMTVSLTSIWFAGGALAALLSQVLGAGIRLQLIVFIVISFLLFLTIRPLATQYVNRGRTKTNVDSFTGRKVIVKERIDNVADTGTVTLSGETWLARAFVEGETFEPGFVVEVAGVKGAKLLVKAEETKEQE